MPKLQHPLTGGIYQKQEDGRIQVEEDGKIGVFNLDGTWHSGELRNADPHMIGWVGGPMSDVNLAARRGPSAASAGTDAPVRKSIAYTPARSEQGGDKRSSEMDLGLQGKKALITAGSRGIGLCIARELADQGADIAICARSEGGLESAKKDIEGRGVKCFTQSVDVGDGEQLRGFVAAAGEALGGLDIVVCNASGGAGMGDAAWQANLDVDLLGAARTVEAAVPFLSASDAGAAVFISSTAALEYLGVPQPYNAMKAAMIAHASDLSQALASKGIRVNTVSPGPIYFEGGNWEMIKNAMPKMYEQALAQCAIGRMGEPEEIARVVTFLASPAASLVTGANIVADGGFTKRVSF